MNTFPKTKSSGFSLVELMVGIVIVAILAAVAVPGFQTWFRNAQIRAAAESIVNGLQRARAEAVVRNTDVHFALDGSSFSSWTVDYAIKPVETDPPIDSRSNNEGSANVYIVALAADLATPATTITFNNLGGVKPDAASLAQVDFTAAGGSQNLRVKISVGGSARMCDPSLAAGSSPRAC